MSVRFPVTVTLGVGKPAEGAGEIVAVDRDYIVAALFDVTVGGGAVVEANQGYDVDVETVAEE